MSDSDPKQSADAPPSPHPVANTPESLIQKDDRQTKQPSDGLPPDSSPSIHKEDKSTDIRDFGLEVLRWQQGTVALLVIALLVFLLCLEHNTASSGGDTSKSDDANAVAFYMEIGKISDAASEERQDIKSLAAKIDEISDVEVKGETDTPAIADLNQKVDQLSAQISEMQHAASPATDPEKLRQITENITAIRQDLAKLETNSTRKS